MTLKVDVQNVHAEVEKTWTQIYTILIVCTNGVVAGALFAWPSPSLPILLDPEQNPYPMTMAELSYLSIIPPIATVLASPFVGSFIDVVGRKKALLSVVIPYVICMVLSAVGGPLYIYYIARVFDGIGDACLFSTLPAYVAEISTPRVRGRWGNAFPLSMYSGQLLMNAVGGYFSIANSMYIILSLPALFILSYPLLKESPYWLLMKDRTDDARESLQWLRGVSNVEMELIQLAADVKRQQSETGRYVDLILIESNRKSAMIVAAVRWMQNFCGASAIAVYIQTIFRRSGSDLPANICSIIYNMSCVLCALIASSILDKLGRRLAFILSCAACSLVLFSQGAVFYINDVTDLNLPGFQILPLVLMILFIMSFSIGMGIVPTLLLGELFSSSIKSKAFVLMNINMGLSVAITAQIFALLLNHVGLYAIFWFYGATTFISMIISYFIVPETTGKTLEEIQQQFKK